MQELAGKIRRMSTILAGFFRTAGSTAKAASVAAECLGTNTIYLNRERRVPGYSLVPGLDCRHFSAMMDADRAVPEAVRRRLLAVESIELWNNGEIGGCFFMAGHPCPYPGPYAAVYPVTVEKERVGTMVLPRYERPFSQEEIVLAECFFGYLTVGMTPEWLERAKEKQHQKEEVKTVLSSLTYSELPVTQEMVNRLKDGTGEIVAGRLADKYGLAHSVVINVFRKLEAASIIRTRSRGAKGNYMTLLNRHLPPLPEKVELLRQPPAG